jgi:hypothetical protein
MIESDALLITIWILVVMSVVNSILMNKKQVKEREKWYKEGWFAGMRCASEIEGIEKTIKGKARRSVN